MTRRVARSPSRMSALTTHDYPGSEEGDPATHRQTTDACRGAQTKGLPIPAMAFPVEEQPLNRPAVEIGLHLPRARREVGDPAPWLVGGLVADRAELSRPPSPSCEAGIRALGRSPVVVSRPGPAGTRRSSRRRDWQQLCAPRGSSRRGSTSGPGSGPAAPRPGQRHWPRRPCGASRRLDLLPRMRWSRRTRGRRSSTSPREPSGYCE